MTSPPPFREAGFLARLEQGSDLPTDFAFPLTVENTPTPAAGWLAETLKGRAAMAKAAQDTVMVADELRRYQKFARPGQPSAHIVQLRQKQASARLDSARAKGAFLKAAQALVREAGLSVPPRTSLEAFVIDWIARQVPADVS